MTQSEAVQTFKKIAFNYPDWKEDTWKDNSASGRAYFTGPYSIDMEFSDERLTVRNVNPQDPARWQMKVSWPLQNIFSIEVSGGTRITVMSRDRGVLAEIKAGKCRYVAKNVITIDDVIRNDIDGKGLIGKDVVGANSCQSALKAALSEKQKLWKVAEILENGFRLEALAGSGENGIFTHILPINEGMLRNSLALNSLQFEE